MMLATLALLAATPTAEAERLGVAVARMGTLASLLPIMTAKEIEEIVADHPELADEDKADLRATATQVAAKMKGHLMQITGHAYATRLSTTEMRAVLAFEASPAGHAYRTAMPSVIIDTLQGAGKLDFKKDVLTAYCAKTGKACPKP